MLHLTVHAADSGAGLLRWLVDLRQALVRYDPDPAALRETARRSLAQPSLQDPLSAAYAA